MNKAAARRNTPARRNWTLFPLSFIYRKSEVLKWVLRAFWLVIALEAWISIGIGVVKPNAVLAPLALVFYKAMTFAALTFLLFNLLPELASKSRHMRTYAVKMKNAADTTGGIGAWTAAMFLLWFSTAVIWTLACIIAWKFFPDAHDLINYMLNQFYSGGSPAPWYAETFHDSFVMMLAVSTVYSVIAYFILLLLNAVFVPRFKLQGTAAQPGPNGLVILVTVIVVNAVFLLWLTATAPPSDPQPSPQAAISAKLI